MIVLDVEQLEQYLDMHANTFIRLTYSILVSCAGSYQNQPNVGSSFFQLLLPRFPWPTKKIRTLKTEITLACAL